MPAAVVAGLLLSGCTKEVERGWLPSTTGTTNQTGRIMSLWNGSWIAALAVGVVVWGLILWAVARMGWIYLIAAVVLGAVFLQQAWVLWRQGSAPEASTAQAIRLYKYSITYLTLLFVAVAVDAVVSAPLG